jgi:cytochrome c peroxidase
MRSKVFVLIFISSCTIVASFAFKKKESPMESLFHQQVRKLISQLYDFKSSVSKKQSADSLKSKFRKSRVAYKRASILIDYFFPILRKSINGPDLKYADDDNPDVINDPHGFQVIERMVYDEVNYDELDKEITALLEIFNSIDQQPELAFKLRNEFVVDAMKSAVIRLVSLGITGFDSPIALNSISESEAVLTGFEDILKIYERDVSIIAEAKLSLSSSKNFDNFDRLQFIQNYAEPLYSQLTSFAVNTGYLLPQERRPLNQLTPAIFSDTLFNIHFFSPNERYKMNPERVELGRSLFYDSIFSRSVKRSCATCHDPDKSFTDGLRVPLSVTGSDNLKRNTPTLTSVAFQTRFFYDSRASTLENQLNSVVHNIEEMDGSLKETVERIREHSKYHNEFKKAYSNDREPVTEYNIANAISSYLRSLPVFNTRFDRYMRGEAKMSSQEKRGFNLFAGKAKCATCHFMPLFNGLVPPQFTETESEVLGVPASATDSVADSDLGKFMFTRSEINKHAFKTPTLRNVTRTAPYMHNGVFKTLEEVMDFYNKGGGEGSGIHLNNQTLPPDKLNLSKKEIKSIIAFLKTLEN